MTLGERVFIYCERGTDEALWAEPINAISNAGFFLAALIFSQLVLWRPPEQRSADHYLFIALVFAICFGSTAFHVFADHGTALADVIPIGLFMLVYFGFALNRFLSVPPGWTVLFVTIFAGLIGAATQLQCWEGGVGFATMAPDEAKSCLNGSVGYLPALGVLLVVSMLVAERRHKAAPYLLAATVVFTFSILLRSVDLAFCESVVIEGRDTGTHFLWHLLNAVVLFLLMRASLETEIKPAPVATEKEPEENAPAAKAELEPKEEPAAKARETPEEDSASDDATKEEASEKESESKDKSEEEASAEEAAEEEPSGADAPKAESFDAESPEDDGSKAEPSEGATDKEKEPS
jgi:hypothetical protein